MKNNILVERFYSGMISCNIITGLINVFDDIINFGYIDVYRYIMIILGLLCNCFWIRLYFNNVRIVLKNNIKSLEIKNKNDFLFLKDIKDRFIGKLFEWNGACILYTFLLLSIHTWFIIIETGFKIWIIFLIILLKIFYTNIISKNILLALNINKEKKSIEKLLKTYKENYNVEETE